MRSGFKIPKELITHIDVMNTLNGGTSEPSLRLKQYDSFREITVRIPGVSRNRIKVEINNHRLMVYYLIEVQSGDSHFPVPRVLYDKPIPSFIDIRKITVREEDGSLIVHLPFNEFASGYRRDFSASS